jgi:GR25 family glycosyltransferase involved in LPS biosynthesis
MNKKQIFVINLDRDKERMQKMDILLEGINYKRYPAIYGKDLSNKEIINKTSKLCRNILCNKGVIGCALSHMNLWKQLIEDKENLMYIIFEDDLIYLDKNNLDNLINFIDNTNYSFDLIYLYCLGVCKTMKDIQINDNLFLYKSMIPTTTAGYIITKEGAKKLLSYLDNVKYHIDISMAITKNIIKDMKVGIVSPYIVKPSIKDSTIITNKFTNITTLTFGQIKQINWILHHAMMTINMTYSIPIYLLVFLFVLLINIFLLKNKYVYYYLIADITLFMATYRK